MALTTVKFETATIADAIKKAAQVAPSRGEAYDKAAGLIIEVNPELSPLVVVRSTNLDVYYREWVNALEVEGEPTIWRLQSEVISSMLNSLPIGSGKTVTFEEVEKGTSSHLVVKSGKTKARFNLMMHDYYPDWDVFDPDDLEVINDLGGKISMVEWAADATGPPLSGIYFTGAELVCTDRYRVARAPLEIPHMPQGRDVVVPAGLLGRVLKQTGEVRVGVSDAQVLLMPNDTTQLRVIRYESEYPGKIFSIMQRDQSSKVEVGKEALLEMIRRSLVFAGSDRMPTLRLFLGAEEVAVMIDHEDTGAIADVIEVPGQAIHKRVEYKFTPKFLSEALEHAPNERVKIAYSEEGKGRLIYISDGSGYECWVTVRGEA